MTTSNFQRCDGDFQKIDEEFEMKVSDTISRISSWINPSPKLGDVNIDHELALLEQYARKGNKKMLGIGTKVIIRTSDDYGGVLTGKVGTIMQVYHKAQKYGIAFADVRNPMSKNGVFWISEKTVTPYKKPEPILSADDVKKVIFNKDKTIILWKDDTKTIVTCGEGDHFDPYSGFCAAVAKRVFGSTSNAKRILMNTAKDMPESDPVD